MNVPQPHNLQLPSNWLIAGLPHQVMYHKVGLWRAISVLTCSCGASARGTIQDLYNAHILMEKEMKIWMEQMNNRRSNYSKKSGPFWV